jgi:hypothetical protein
MNHPPLSVEGVGDESKKTQNQCSDHNARPNENRPNHPFTLGILENWNIG